MPQNDGWEDLAPAKGAPTSYPAAASSDEWEDIAPPLQSSSAAGAQSSAPEQPGFFARASERLLGTQHPVDQAITEAKFAYEHPGEAAKQTIRGVGQDLYGLATMPAHPIKATGGEEFAQDIANGNYRGAAGTLAGDVLPIAIASPEAWSAAAEAPARIGDVASRVPEATARTLRNEKGALRPSVRSIARAGGAAAGTAIGGTPGGVVGALSGPSIVDAITPRRAPMPEPIERPPFGGTSTHPSTVSALPEIPSPASAAPAAGQMAPPNVTVAAPAAPRVAQMASPESYIVPEPRGTLAGEKPGSMYSIPRDQLVRMAQSAKPGAADVLRNLGKPVIFEPTSTVGFPGSSRTIIAAPPEEEEEIPAIRNRAAD